MKMTHLADIAISAPTSSASWALSHHPFDPSSSSSSSSSCSVFFSGRIPKGCSPMLVENPTLASGGNVIMGSVSARKRGNVIEADEFDSRPYKEEELPPKPLGFGQGKSYDISLEEKILEEIERDRIAQTAASSSNRKKLEASKKQDPTKKKNSTALPTQSTATGVKVMMQDLPKKKNIKRDLLSAFKHVPGLLEISPSILGNEKTRDPICKGFGFLIFDNIDNARSFVSSFEGEPIQFGKVTKQPSYRMLNEDVADTMSVNSKFMNEVPRLRIREKSSNLIVKSLVSDAPSSDTEYGILVSNVVSAEKAPTFQLQKNGTLQTEILQKEKAALSAEVELYEEYDISGEEDDDDDINDEIELGDEDGDEDEDEDDEDYEYFDDDVQVEFFASGENENLVVIDNSLKDNQDESRDIDVHMSESERRIEELENNLRKKLRVGEIVDKQIRSEEQVSMANSKAFKVRKTRGSKKIKPKKGNNVAAVTTGLKKNDRAIMMGVLEKYGKHPKNTLS